VGHPEAERVIVVMGSGAECAHETVDHLVARGEKVGVLKVRLYRPFGGARFVPRCRATVRALAVLDRTKEPGATASRSTRTSWRRWPRPGPRATLDRLPRVIGGRYGLASKEFTPAMVKAVFDELAGVAAPALHGRHRRRRHPPLAAVRPDFDRARPTCPRGVLRPRRRRHGRRQQELDQDHRRGDAELAQGYFVYDSKKSGATRSRTCASARAPSARRT
jgi:pyruvate-ferredoxin/flavodoxin oxidoreductase